MFAAYSSTGCFAVYNLSDFVFTRPKLVHSGLRGFLYSDIRQRLFRRLFGGRQISSATMMSVLQLLVGLYVLLMLLLPMGLMFLMELSKSALYGLPVGFAVLFSISFAATDASFVHVLLATFAYMALLLLYFVGVRMS